MSLPIRNEQVPGQLHPDDTRLHHASSAFYRRHSRSPTSKERIVIKNRRKRYLDTHPDYVASPSLELAGLHSLAPGRPNHH